ncbi:MAG: hypothetical protein JSS35_03990 [Proteobacteria bacterium]|nr:hypothetical protein [Pseudomonadota bacterium]
MTFDPPDPPDFDYRPRPGAVPGWLEWLTSLSALVVSISSIFIAVHNSHDADKALAAQTYPYLDQGPSNATPDGTYRLSIDLMNHGVGPANEQSLRIRVGDHYFHNVDELIAAAVGAQDAAAARVALNPYTNSVPTRFIPANTTQFIFQMTRTPQNADWWRLMNKASQTWVIETCYCSVFKECWVRVNQDPPTPVKACKRDPAQEFTPA